MRDDDLHAFVGAARARMSADERRRRRWLGRQLDDDRTFAAICGRACEAGAHVRLDLVDGRTHRGRMLAAGPQVLVVATHDGATAYIALPAVVALDVPGTAAGAAAGRRPRVDGRHGGTLRPGPAAPATVAEVLWDVAERCATADIGVVGGARYRGGVVAAGRDIVTLADGRSVRLAMVTDVVTVP